MIGRIDEERSLWVASGPPAYKRTGRKHAHPTRDNIIDLLREFKTSGDDCWRKDYQETRYGFSKAAESDAAYISVVGGVEGVTVSRRGSSVYLERKEDWLDADAV